MGSCPVKKKFTRLGPELPYIFGTKGPSYFIYSLEVQRLFF